MLCLILHVLILSMLGAQLSSVKSTLKDCTVKLGVRAHAHTHTHPNNILNMFTVLNCLPRCPGAHAAHGCILDTTLLRKGLIAIEGVLSNTCLVLHDLL